MTGGIGRGVMTGEHVAAGLLQPGDVIRVRHHHDVPSAACLTCWETVAVVTDDPAPVFGRTAIRWAGDARIDGSQAGVTGISLFAPGEPAVRLESTRISASRREIQPGTAAKSHAERHSPSASLTFCHRTVRVVALREVTPGAGGIVEVRSNSCSRRFPVTVTRHPVTRCQIGQRTVACHPGNLSEVFTGHYRPGPGIPGRDEGPFPGMFGRFLPGGIRRTQATITPSRPGAGRLLGGRLSLAIRFSP